MTLKSNAAQLVEALTGKALDETEAESLAAAAIPFLKMLDTLNSIDVEGIEPPLLPLWKGELA